MNCHEIENLLSAYVDKQLSAEDAKAVEDHVMSCRSCSGTLVQLRRLVGLLGGIPRAACPGMLAGRLQEAAVTAARGGPAPALAGKAARRSSDFFLRYKHFIQFAVAAAAVALIALANVYIFAPSRRREPAAETAFSRKDNRVDAPVDEKPGRVTETAKSVSRLHDSEDGADFSVHAKGGAAGGGVEQRAGKPTEEAQQVLLENLETDQDKLENAQKKTEDMELAEKSKAAGEKLDRDSGAPTMPDTARVPGEPAAKTEKGQSPAMPYVCQVTLACASQEATRNKVDDILRRSLGDESQMRLRRVMIAKAQQSGAPAADPAAERPEGRGTGDVTRRELDKARDGEPGVELPWKEVKQIAQARRARGGAARSAEPEAEEERKELSAAKSQPETTGGLAQPTALLLAIDVLESEADAVIAGLQKEAGIDATFASSLTVAGGKHFSGYLDEGPEVAGQLAEEKLNKEGGMEFEKQVESPDAGVVAGKKLRREQKGDAPAEQPGESLGVGFGGKTKGGESQPPASGQQIARRVRLVIRLVLQPEPTEKTR